MSAPKTVYARDFRGLSMSLAQLWGSGPKFTVQCGHCDGVFKDRIIMVDYPRLRCPFCGTVNILNLEIK